MPSAEAIDDHCQAALCLAGSNAHVECPEVREMVDLTPIGLLFVVALCMWAMFRQPEPPRINRRDYHLDVREFMFRTDRKSKGGR
jgi:hypothetical protein